MTWLTLSAATHPWFSGWRTLRPRGSAFSRAPSRTQSSLSLRPSGGGGRLGPDQPPTAGIALASAESPHEPSANSRLGDPPSQTPLFHTLNSARYARQSLIRSIEGHTGRRLICWVADDHAQIDGNDIPPLGDLLHDLSGEEPLDLLLRSPGGVIDSAEKIVLMLRKRSVGLRVIVPEAAKSAATLIAIASDQILMGYTSELGPIDPQVPVLLPNGNWALRPAHSILEGLAEIKRETEAAGGVLSSAYLPMLQSIDPALLDVCREAIAHSHRFAETWLAKYQCAGDPESARRIAQALEDPQLHHSHGAVIDAAAASALGLNVCEREPNDPLWDAIWRLYVDLFVGVRATQSGQLFESRSASISY